MNQKRFTNMARIHCGRELIQGFINKTRQRPNSCAAIADVVLAGRYRQLKQNHVPKTKNIF